ncbi:uncharacterized protein BDW70DRAFT_133905 [Aspergillus foveolatus]|uniref:uncharacterized protein n=1 Tax=Aspergillus foveolatus TaxID=210207 RepID=UPI003CCE1FE7
MINRNIPWTWYSETHVCQENRNGFASHFQMYLFRKAISLPGPKHSADSAGAIRLQEVHRGDKISAGQAICVYIVQSCINSLVLASYSLYWSRSLVDCSRYLFWAAANTP